MTCFSRARICPFGVQKGRGLKEMKSLTVTPFLWMVLFAEGGWGHMMLFLKDPVEKAAVFIAYGAGHIFNAHICI